jgi:hypothetical protein
MLPCTPTRNGAVSATRGDDTGSIGCVSIGAMDHFPQGQWRSPDIPQRSDTYLPLLRIAAAMKARDDEQSVTVNAKKTAYRETC